MRLMCQIGRIVSILTLTLALGVGIGLAQEKSASYWFNRAFQETNIDQKIEYYRKSIQLYPQNADAHNNLGVLYKKKGMYDEAIAEYKAALAIPDYETPEYAYHNLGVLYRDRTMYEQAVDYFKQAISINSQFVKAHNALGLAYKGLGRYEEAITSFKQALKINPNYVQASYNLQNLWRLSKEDTAVNRQAEALYDEGIKLLNQNQPQAAVAKFQEALKLNPQHAGAKEKLKLTQNRLECNKWCVLGEKFFAQKQWERASSCFNKALNYATSDEERQRITGQQRKIQTQIRLQTRKVELDKLCQQGLNCLDKQDWLPAISKFTKVLMLDPQHKLAQEKNNLAKAGYYYEKGVDFLNAQRWQEAEEKFNDVLRANPQHAGAKAQLEIIAKHRADEKIKGWLQQAEQARGLDDFKTAEQMYQHILELDAKHLKAQAGLAWVKQQAKPDSSESFLSYLISPLKLVSFIIIVLAGYLVFAKFIRPSQVIEHYLKYKEYDKARVVYEKILEKDNNRWSIYPSLTNTYIQLKRPDGVERLIQLCQQKIQQAAAPKIPLWRLCLGEIYQQQGKLDDAQREMELAYKEQPNNQEIQQKLATLYTAILNLRSEDTQIAAKLERLKAKLGASPKQQKPALPQMKVKNQADEEHSRQLLKECFGHSKG